MNFFEKNLKETLETIKTFGNGIITVKKIRTANNIKSSNRSKINFIWRALKSLVDLEFLELNSSKGLKSYKLRYPGVEMNIEDIISLALRKRKKRSYTPK